MPSIAARCHELRVQDETVTWCLVYRIDPEVVDVFTKKEPVAPGALFVSVVSKLSLRKPIDGFAMRRCR